MLQMRVVDLPKFQSWAHTPLSCGGRAILLPPAQARYMGAVLTVHLTQDQRVNVSVGADSNIVLRKFCGIDHLLALESIKNL